jgi:hypothetical protein
MLKQAGCEAHLGAFCEAGVDDELLPVLDDEAWVELFDSVFDGIAPSAQQDITAAALAFDLESPEAVEAAGAAGVDQPGPGGISERVEIQRGEVNAAAAAASAASAASVAAGGALKGAEARAEEARRREVPETRALGLYVPTSGLYLWPVQNHHS